MVRHRELSPTLSNETTVSKLKIIIPYGYYLIVYSVQFKFMSHISFQRQGVETKCVDQNTHGGHKNKKKTVIKASDQLR